MLFFAGGRVDARAGGRVDVRAGGRVDVFDSAFGCLLVEVRPGGGCVLVRLVERAGEEGFADMGRKEHTTRKRAADRAFVRYHRAVKLVVSPPLEPMLSKRATDLPTGEGWMYEPKWDGFRALAFRDGDELFIQSRDEKPLLRYFPELDAPLKRALPERAVVDGEIVIATNGVLDFEALQHRLHPAASRVALLAKETPAAIVLWDLIAIGDEDLRAVPFRERRARLEDVLRGVTPPVYLTPMTTDRALATDWFHRFEGAGFDGVMAKPAAGAYEPGKRAMVKVKHDRTCDCVVAGFRWHKNGKGTLVGSLLLGLYDASGALHHVGVTASFTEKRRAELAEELAPLRENALENHPWKDWAGPIEDGTRKPGATSRWNPDKNLGWEPLRIERVVEVGYDHMQGQRRFRHTAQFKRWRDDKRPRDCGYDQLEVTPPAELSQMFASKA
jgi:ATP-dependent DNA ligase